jgi:hypothetical protein
MLSVHALQLSLGFACVATLICRRIITTNKQADTSSGFNGAKAGRFIAGCNTHLAR